MNATSSTQIPPAGVFDAESSRPQVNVIFTDMISTLAGLREASRLTADLHALIRVVVPQVVPYPLPLDEPPVGIGFRSRQFRTMAGEAGVETRFDVFLCRDREQVFRDHLTSGALVVLAGQQSWWPSPVTRLRRWLERSGYQVVFVDTRNRQNPRSTRPSTRVAHAWRDQHAS